MKILYITSLAFRKSSSASIRNISLINGLVEHGYNVDLLTLEYPPNMEDDYLKGTISNKVRVYSSEANFLNNYLKNKKNSASIKKETTVSKIKKVIKNIYFFPDVDKEWINDYNKEILNNDYDIIISSSDTKTSHFLGNEIKNIKQNVKWLQIWGDPWESDINIQKYMRSRIRKHENRLLNLADSVLYVSEPTADYMRKQYPDFSNKIHYLGRSFLESIKGRNIGEKEYFELSYTGSLNRNRNIEHLISAIKRYNKEHAKKIKLNLYGIIDNETQTLIEDEDFVEHFGSVNLEKISDVYYNSDVLIYIDNGGKTTQIPGKLYDYMGTDRPILALVDDHLDLTTSFLDSINRCVIQLNQPEMIKLDFLENIKEEKIIDDFSGGTIARKLIRFIKKI